MIKLAYSPGTVVTLFLFVGSRLCMWVIIFVHGWSFSFVGGLPHMWVVIFMCVCSSSMWVIVCIWGQVDVVVVVVEDMEMLWLLRVVVVVVVVMGCGHCVHNDALWTLLTWLWLWSGSYHHHHVVILICHCC